MDMTRYWSCRLDTRRNSSSADCPSVAVDAGFTMPNSNGGSLYPLVMPSVRPYRTEIPKELEASPSMVVSASVAAAVAVTPPEPVEWNR